MIRPTWVEGYLTDKQLSQVERPHTLWVALLNRSAVSAHAHHVALRLHVFTLGRDAALIYPSVASLARDVKLSATSTRTALGELEECGWIRRERRWLPSGEPTSSLITLSWPVSAAEANMHELVVAGSCGAQRSAKKGGQCRRRAGFGTATPGAGPCIHHGGAPPSPDEVPPSSDEVPPSSRGVHVPRPARPSALPEGTTEGTTQVTARTSASATVSPLPARPTREYDDADA